MTEMNCTFECRLQSGEKRFGIDAGGIQIFGRPQHGVEWKLDFIGSGVEATLRFMYDADAIAFAEQLARLAIEDKARITISFEAP